MPETNVRKMEIRQNAETERLPSTPLNDKDHTALYGSVIDSAGHKPLDSNLRKGYKCLHFLSRFAIEATIFSYTFAYALNLSCLTNMMMDKGCLYSFKYSTEICSNLSAHAKEKTNVEVLGSNFTMYCNLMTLTAAFVMIFIAPWSDKYGRKPPLIMAVLGALLSDIGLILCIIYFDSKLEYIILSRLPGEILGGQICVLTTVYSYVSEMTSEETRTLKYTSTEIADGIGMCLGTITGGMLYRDYGYFYVYLTVVIMRLCCLLWIMFILREIRGLDLHDPWLEKLKNLFDCRNFTKGWNAVVKPRENKERTMLLVLLASICITHLHINVFSSIEYVYVHAIYNWDPAIYSVVSTSVLFARLLVTLVLVPLLIKACKINDPMLGLIGTSSMIGKNIILAFAKYYVWIYYFGCVVSLLGNLPDLAIQSGLSKILKPDELGVVFSFFTTLNSIIPMLGLIGVTKVFNATINIYPSICYLMMALLLSLPLGTFIWFHVRIKRKAMSCHT